MSLKFTCVALALPVALVPTLPDEPEAPIEPLAMSCRYVDASEPQAKVFTVLNPERKPVLVAGVLSEGGQLTIDCDALAQNSKDPSAILGYRLGERDTLIAVVLSQEGDH